MVASSPLLEARAALSQVLLETSPGPVAWGGAGGASHYRAAGGVPRSLERIASWAEDEVDLMHLALGWRHAHPVSDADGPLVLVIEDLPPGFLASLEAAGTPGADLLVVLLDAGRRYAEESRALFGGRGVGSPGPYAEARGFRFLAPVELGRHDRLHKAVRAVLEERGVRFLHVLGPAPEGGAPSLSRRRSGEQWLPSTPGRTGPSWPGPVESAPTRSPAPAADSLELQVLSRLSTDLLEIPEVVCFWARSASPGPLGMLGRRLRRCPLDGALLEAAGAAAAGSHPVLALGASDLPGLLPQLLEMAAFPLTLLVTGGGLSPAAGSEEPDPAGVRDLSFLRQVPEITVAVPADEEEARGVLRSLLALPGPGALRLTSSPAVGIPGTEASPGLPPGVGRRLRPGGDLSLVCLGSTVFPAVLASEALNSWGIRAGVYDMRYLEPLDRGLLEEAASCGRILTVEEHCIHGGLGTAVLETLAGMGRTGVRVEVGGILPTLADPDPEAHGLTAEGIAEAARRMLGLGTDSGHGSKEAR